MTTNLIDLTGFATLLKDIVASAETSEERTHLESVIERLKDGEPTTQLQEAATV